MKLRTLAVIFALALASLAAHAQTGVYATFNAQRFSLSGLVVNPAADGTNSTAPWLYGTTYGAYYEIHHMPKLITRLPGTGLFHTGPILVGIDGRGDIFRGSLYDREDGFFSFRFSPKKAKRMVPYLQAGVGVAHTRLPNASTYSNNIALQFGAGVDRKLRGRIDWRVVEVTGGFLRDYRFGYNQNQSNYQITLGTGLVFHLF